MKLPKKALTIFYNDEWYDLSDEDVKMIKSLMEYPAIKYLFGHIKFDSDLTNLVTVVNHWGDLSLSPECRYVYLQNLFEKYDITNVDAETFDELYESTKELYPDLKYLELPLAKDD